MNAILKSEQSNVQESTKVLAMRLLQAELPLNDFGLPTGIYRTDLLPFDTFVPPHSCVFSGPPELSGSPLPAHATRSPSAVSDLDLSPKPDPSEVVIDAAPSAVDTQDGPPIDSMHANTDTDAHTPPQNLAEYRIAGFPSRALQQAFVPLQYDEGYPAFGDGRAFWSKLDYEPNDAFIAFERYLQMSFGRTADVQDEDDFGEAANGIRSISDMIYSLFPMIDDVTLLTKLELYKEYFHVYYWGLRAKAYDFYRVAQYRRQQELRAFETQDDHYIQSRKLRARVTQYMDSEEDFWDMMTPKTALDIFRTTTQLERVSAGLPAMGPAIDKDGSAARGGPSFELTYRTIAQGQRKGADEEGGNLISEEGEILDRALGDPDTVRVLQELIIKGG